MQFSSLDMVQLLDYTQLDEHASQDDVAQLCDTALQLPTEIAAICIYPKFVALVKEKVHATNIKVATVINFPKGQDKQEKIIADTQFAVQQGADEIDIVLPYQLYLANRQAEALAIIEICRRYCQDAITLKVILETGALCDETIIAHASVDCIAAGADFLKTSTGKIAQGASLSAAAVMLSVIKQHAMKTKHRVGFKASGGIRDKQQAVAYLYLASTILGCDWINAQSFRFGASSLLLDLLNSPPDN